MQAVILAGGQGTRVRPLTATVPKPVMPLAGRPFLVFCLDWLVEHGIDEVLVCAGVAAQQIEAVLGKRHRSARLRYLHEEAALGTAGPVRLASDRGLLDERFFVLNGDILTDLDLSSQLEWHARAGAQTTLALIEVSDPSPYGSVYTGSTGRVERFVEKQSHAGHTTRVSAGVYTAERSICALIDPGRAVSFESEIFPVLARSQTLYGYVADGYWIDIGTPERYLEATRDLLSGRAGANLPARDSNDSLIYDSRHLGGARIGPLSVIGRDCTVGAQSVVDRSVLFDRVSVGADCSVTESILADGVTVLDGARIGPGAVVGEGARIGSQAVVGSGARIQPNEHI